MTEKMDETLKKIAAATQKSGEIPDSSPGLSTQSSDLAGDPDCPHCGGLGYLRTDLPVGHPEFGKVEICPCRAGEISKKVHQRLFALSNLNELRHLTFENFQLRGRIGLGVTQANSLEQAYNQARQFAQTLDGWLLLQGPYGCGKTHLAAAIANFAVEMGVSTLFITVPDLLDSLRFSYSNVDVSFEERFEEIRQAPLLVFDDFGTQNATPWAQEKLFQIMNYRYINRLPQVVTTNLSLNELEGRIRSRLLDPELVSRVKILAEDYRRPSSDAGFSEISSLGLMHGKTLSTFELRKGEGLPKEDLQSLKRTFDAAVAFAEKPAGWVIFTGPYGCGKTHLAAAIANYHHDLGNPHLFVVVPDLLDHLRATFSPDSFIRFDRLFEEVRSTPLLILDDLGTQSMTPWVREKLFQIFNYRYNAELPTVITTSDYREEMDARLRSRFEDTRLCIVYAITAPGYRGKSPKKR
ncbi:MAG: ATP-binding protein [Anaerolineales bacterium]|nr:ATP-binding protein [Anaerolineales bacterium]